MALSIFNACPPPYSPQGIYLDKYGIFPLKVFPECYTSKALAHFRVLTLKLLSGYNSLQFKKHLSSKQLLPMFFSLPEISITQESCDHTSKDGLQGSD